MFDIGHVFFEAPRLRLMPCRYVQTRCERVERETIKSRIQMWYNDLKAEFMLINGQGLMKVVVIC